MLVIIGESASGKTTIVNELVNSSKDYRKIVTYTTRPMRDGEVDGVDYHFITQAMFEEMKKRDFFAETNSYNGWNYGTALSDCSDDHHVVAVLTPAGLRSLKRSGVNTLSVYIWVDRRSRLIKCLNRGDNIDEACRRSLSDVGQFDAVEKEVDYIIDNTRYKMNVIDVLRCLREIIKTESESSEQSNG